MGGLAAACQVQQQPQQLPGVAVGSCVHVCECGCFLGFVVLPCAASAFHYLVVWLADAAGSHAEPSFGLQVPSCCRLVQLGSNTGDRLLGCLLICLCLPY